MPELFPGTGPPGHASFGQFGESDEFNELRLLLVGQERAQLRKLQERLEDPSVRANDVSEVLADAIRICAARNSELGRSLSHVVENVLRNLVRQEPSILTDTIYPVMGRSIRKAIGAALQAMAQSLNRVVEQSLTLRGLQWRLEAWRTGKSYGEIVLLRSLLYRVEQVFLIHKRTGLLLQQVAAADVIRDPDLVSAMLAAIQDFVRDSFASGDKDELETIQVGDLGVWIQHGPLALLAGVVRGVAPRELSSVFQETLEGIHQEQARELESFSGDAAAFDASRPRLQACLLGNAAPKRRRRRLSRWVFAGAVAAVVVAGLAWAAASIRDAQRWNRSLALLHSEPGILVTNAEKRDGRYYLRGLRDPLSKDPLAVLREAGVDARRVTWQGEPFVSLHPRFAAVRRFEQQRAEIERAAIHFNLGSAAVLPGQLDAVNELAAAARSLFSSAEAAGQAVQLEVIGHADAVGTREANARLSQNRASSVVRLLIAAGLPRDRILARAGPPAETATAGAEMERRVSFRVVTADR